MMNKKNTYVISLIFAIIICYTSYVYFGIFLFIFIPPLIVYFFNKRNDN